MVSPVDSTTFGQLGLGVPQTVKKQELGQDAFMQLMLTQLKNQDPFKPLDSGDFLGQLAQSTLQRDACLGDVFHNRFR